jgi:hypothetical protein
LFVAFVGAALKRRRGGAAAEAKELAGLAR